MRSIWTVFWVIVVVLLLSTLTVAVIAFNAADPTKNQPIIEAVKATLLCLGGSGVILSTYFTAVNAFNQRRSDVIKNTFDLLVRWDDPHLFNARKWTRRAGEKGDDTSINKLLSDIEDSEELKNSVILVLNYCEHIRISIKTNRIDKEIFKKSLGDAIISVSNRFMPYAKKINPQVETDLRELIKELQ